MIGPSGCGKSTLARLVAGLEEPSGGEMLLDGKPIHGPGADRGMVFQSYTLFPWLTVLKNVMFGMEVAARRPAPTRRGEAQMWLEVVGLSKFADAYPHQLSGGMKQRVAIARALANRPRILLMDEPFGALDAQTRCQMQSYLLQIWKQVDITILFITHDLDEAVYLADRILILDAHPGRLREVMEVPVPRPRSPDQFLEPTFIAARRHLEELIHPRAAQAADKLPLVPHGRWRETTSNDRPILHETLRGGQAWSRRLARHQRLRLTDVEGRACVSALFYNARDPLERYNMPDTLKAQFTAFLTTGRVLYSDMGRVLCSIVADDCGWHDTISGHRRRGRRARALRRAGSLPGAAQRLPPQRAATTCWSSWASTASASATSSPT